MDQYKDLTRRQKQLLDWMSQASQGFFGSPDTPAALYFNGESVGVSDQQRIPIEIDELGTLQSMGWLKIRWRPPEQMELGYVDLTDRTHLGVLRRFGTKPDPIISENAKKALTEAYNEVGKRPFDASIYEYSGLQETDLNQALGELIRAKLLLSGPLARFFQLMPVGRALAEELLGKSHDIEVLPMSVDDYSNLTHRNRALLTWIVRTCRTDVAGSTLGKLYFDGQQVGFHNFGFEAASKADMDDLIGKGLISVTWLSNQITGHVVPTNEGYLAVLGQFNRQLEPKPDVGAQPVLGAAFAHLNGKADEPFFPATLARYTAGNDDFVREALQRLSKLHYAQPYSGGTFALTPEGVAYAKWIERPKQKAQPSGGNIMGDQINIHDSSIAGLQYKTVSSSQSANQTIGSDLAAVLELLDRSKVHLAGLPDDDRQEAEDQIEHIKDEVKTGNPTWKKIKSFMRVLVLLTATVPKFQDDMQQVCHNLKVEKQEIQKVFSAAQ